MPKFVVVRSRPKSFDEKKPAAPAELRIVSDRATGNVIRIETVLTDGTLCVIRPLTPEEIEEFERELTAPRH